MNGPLNDKIGFSLGGYIMEDAGYKEWAIKDKGGQISANLDIEVSEKFDLRLYGIVGNNQFNNLTDSPYDLGNRSLADGWSSNNTLSR